VVRSRNTGGIDEIRQGNRVAACVDSSPQASIYSSATHASSNCAPRRGARVHARGNDGVAVRRGGRHLEEDGREVLLEEVVLVEGQRIQELEQEQEQERLHRQGCSGQGIHFLLRVRGEGGLRPDGSHHLHP